MSSNYDKDRWRRPETFFADLINKSVSGELLTREENPQVWHRAVVVAVDVIGGMLQNPQGQGTVTHIIDGAAKEINATFGPRNPRNSVKARKITNQVDRFVDEKDLQIYWPMMGEHDSLPVKPGEMVYVTYEDQNFVHGLWFGKVAGQDNVNYSDAYASYQEESNSSNLASKFGDVQKPSEQKLNTENMVTGYVPSQDKNKLFEGQ